MTKPSDVVEALRLPGRSPGDTARFVNEFFARSGIEETLDEPVRTAEARRQRRLEQVPSSLRRAVESFVDHLLRGRARAALVGSKGLADRTIETRIAHLAELGEMLAERGITEWAGVTASDVEIFIHDASSRSRLACARAFFAFARNRRLILVNPTTGVGRASRRGFAGRILTTTEQRALVKRWTRGQTPPCERLVGLLSLVHAACSAELRALTVDDVDLTTGHVKLAQRAQPVPLDPLTLDAIRAVLEDHARMRTDNPHLIVTRSTRWHGGPCSEPYMTHVLDAAGTRPSVLRQTRLADLAHRTDPRLLAAAIGITAQGALHYLTDTVDREHIVFDLDS